ncbi:hypothetical protein [Streptomyces sp. NPDC089919]|uniref:hypothetical protein n=1 Tax=Streptomyces sp. NPDC089919 TaxID=3155188 RepID=UPI003434BF4D
MHARPRALAAAAFLAVAALPLTACSSPAPAPAKAVPAAPARHLAPPRPAPVLGAAPHLGEGQELLRVDATSGGRVYELPAAADGPGALAVAPACLGDGTLEVVLPHEMEFTLHCTAGEVAKQLNQISRDRRRKGPTTIALTPSGDVRWNLTVAHDPHPRATPAG